MGEGVTYTWQWYDRETGTLYDRIEEGEPHLCHGDDLPHPQWMCALIVDRLSTQALRAAVKELPCPGWFYWAPHPDDPDVGLCNKRIGHDGLCDFEREEEKR
jgi:hypothetical protein